MTVQLLRNAPPWPNGARCAVCFSFDFDAESLLHLYYPQDARRRISLASTLHYGATVAIPRLVEICRHFDIRQTVFTPGWCIETYPAAMALLVEHGHEIGHHGWLHERPNALTPEDEALVMAKGIEAITRLTGKKPAGYRAPSGAFSATTAELLARNSFLYDASLGGDDVPYLLQSAAGPVLELPADHAMDDWTQYVNSRDFNWMLPIQSPTAATALFREEFDAAWEQGGLWITIWHPFVSGRLGRAAAIVRLIEHMQAKGGVWFAPLAEVAAHVHGLIESGAWTPRVETVPFWENPVPQLVRPVL
jgi:peptidoglycan/xylan/chitin deacetylase (PgdA/CDA1 family)